MRMGTRYGGFPSLVRGGDPAGIDDLATSTGQPDESVQALDELRLIAERMRALEALEVEAVWRARVAGVPWRSIAASTGVADATIRRWAARSPAATFTRRRGDS